MILKLTSSSVVILDLDDTLYYEIDFVKSAFRFIVMKIEQENKDGLYTEMLQLYYEKQDVFEAIISKYKINHSKEQLLNWYRNHTPSINLNEDVHFFLDTLKDYQVNMGIITDGRSITQRNKLSALNILDYFNDIVISEESGFEKPAPENFTHFEKKYQGASFVYIGDNTNKDFIVPNKLKWETIGVLDKGLNIHPQDLKANPLFLPQNFVKSFLEIVIQYER